jgi:lysozyme
MARDVSPLIAEALPILVELCVRFEGVYLRPYLCPAGVPTIGIGTTRYLDGRAVQLTDPAITRETALVLLRHQLRATYIPGTLRACPTIDTPGRLAAIADLAYNIGVGALRASTLRRRILAERWDDVPGELRRWNRGGGRVLPGLVRRREAEVALI